MLKAPKVSLPPASADCEATFQAPNGPPVKQAVWKVQRSADGKQRFDYGDRSVITDPAAGKAMILDHIKKEAIAVPIPQPKPLDVPNISVPGFQPPSATPPPTPIHVQDLGKKVIDGVEVEGRKYTLPLPQPPRMPQAPHTPGIPQAQIPPLP